MVKKIVFSALIFLLTLEAGLRISGSYLTSSERSSGFYANYYRKHFPSWYHHWSPGKTVDYKTTEFHYLNAYNELGHRERSFSETTGDTAAEKVVCTGDSFTEGDGTPYDSTWVRSVEQLSVASGKKRMFYNAGVCGSDVFFNHRMLEDKLLAMKPGVVIECLNSSDLTDVIWMGGNERFNPDGTTSGKVGPRWSLFYKYLHVFRAIVHTVLGYDDNLVRERTREAQQQQAAAMIAEEADRMKKRLDEQGVAYFVVLHPCPHEIATNDPAMTYLAQHLGRRSYVIDISDSLRAFYRTHDLKQFSHAVNGHYNSKGYWVMGEIIFTRLREAGY